LIIVTEEDYRTEDLNKINRDIISGIKKNKFKYKKPTDLTRNSAKVFTIITDRESAIKKAINIAKKNDIVLLTGKSHEKSITRGNKDYPWNEKNIVFKYLNKKNGK